MLPEAPRKRYADGVDPVTSPDHTEAYRSCGTMGTSRRAFVRDKTGDPVRSRFRQHGLVGLDDSIFEHHVSTDPVEEMASELLSDQFFTQDQQTRITKALLRLRYKECRCSEQCTTPGILCTDSTQKKYILSGPGHSLPVARSCRGTRYDRVW